ncbi:hypothetical protein [Thermococcus henrietii]|uniref:hypothetical protein n=1 Tax=Thermococcus henrietii TaxID=2016361 RepID=UPI002948C34F|nr:hypothetical protein [Thermococcus henrietii]
MRRFFGVLLVGILLLSVLGAGCISTGTTTGTKTSGGGAGKRSADQLPNAVNENGNVNTGDLKSYIDSVPAGTLTPEEKDGLLYMVEEES